MGSLERIQRAEACLKIAKRIEAVEAELVSIQSMIKDVLPLFDKQSGQASLMRGYLKTIEKARTAAGLSSPRGIFNAITEAD